MGGPHTCISFSLLAGLACLHRLGRELSPLPLPLLHLHAAPAAHTPRAPHALHLHAHARTARACRLDWWQLWACLQEGAQTFGTLYAHLDDAGSAASWKKKATYTWHPDLINRSSALFALRPAVGVALA